MGISNLLPYVRSACRPVTLDDLRGQTVAVDTSCWLHRGVFGCIQDITDGKDTDFYVGYCMKYIRLLLKYNMRVILVFDGRSLPAKQEVNRSRTERKERLREEAKRLSQEGKGDEAWDCLKQTTHITFHMIHKLIQAVAEIAGVDCLVSPYESDAQLTYLCAKGIVHTVITEDSDLIPFGCKRILFKLDTNGTCTLYERSRLHLVHNHIDSSKFDFEKFRRTCILAGCDYLLQGLPGVGLIKAAKFFSITNSRQLAKVLPKIRYYLKMPKLNVTNEFIGDFIRAEETFLYQIVFDPVTRTQLPLNAYPNDGRVPKDFCHAGQVVEKAIAIDLASAALDTRTMRPVKRVYDVNKITDVNSIWHKNHEPKCTPKKLSPQKSPQKKPSAFVVTHKSPVKYVPPGNKPKTTPVKRFESSEPNSDDILSIYGIGTTNLVAKIDKTHERKVCSPYFCSPDVVLEASARARRPFKVPKICEKREESHKRLRTKISDNNEFFHTLQQSQGNSVQSLQLQQPEGEVMTSDPHSGASSPPQTNSPGVPLGNPVNAGKEQDFEPHSKSTNEGLSVLQCFTHIREPLAKVKVDRKRKQTTLNMFFVK